MFEALLTRSSARLKKEMRVWRDAPVSAVLIVAVSVGATRWCYAERLGIMEQRVRLAEQTARAASVDPSSGPLPRYSLGGTPGGTTGLRFDNAGQWRPAAYYRDVELDWAELDDVEVVAELQVWVRDLAGEGREGWGQVRVKNVTDDAVVTEGDRLPAARGLLQRFQIPRSTGQKVYRVEVLAANRWIAILGDVVLTHEPS